MRSRWTAMEFAEVCEAVAAELRVRSAARTILPSERLALFEWYDVVKDVVQRLEASHSGPGLAKPNPELGGRGAVRMLRAVSR